MCVPMLLNRFYTSVGMYVQMLPNQFCSSVGMCVPMLLNRFYTSVGMYVCSDVTKSVLQ